jgi:pimeloyl-ACP methyl ester carboxylesterase
MPDSILFMPGLLCDARLWRDQLAALAPITHAIVADLTQDDSLDGMANRALAAMPGRFALCGLSMGGYAALALMRLAPDRVTRLCLMDTSARADSPEQSRRRRGLIATVRRNPSQTTRFRGVTPRLLPMLIHPDRLSDTALTQDVIGMAERVGQMAFLRQQTAILARPDSRPDLPAIAVPTMVAAGAQDALTPPSDAEEMASLIPGAQLRIIPNCGHLAPMERPNEVSAILDQWLKLRL